MAFLKLLFLIMDTICIQVLKAVFWSIRVEVEVIINLPPQINKQMKWVNQVLKQYLWCIINHHYDNWSNLLYMAEFTYKMCCIHQHNKHLFLQIMVGILSFISKTCITSWILHLKIKPCGWQTFKHNLYPTLKRNKDNISRMKCTSQGSTIFQG
jgi:hypothetical protein